MKTRSNIDKIVNIMEMMDPTAATGMGGPTAMDASPLDSIDMDIIPNQQILEPSSVEGFNANDYLLAKQLVSQVGSVERVRELLSNLEQVMDTLNLKDTHVDDIAQCCEEDI